MSEAWYLIPDASPVMRQHFQKTAPEAFRRNVFCDAHVFSNPHPSSREPGNLEDLRHRCENLLAALPPTEREAYRATHAVKMADKPRIHSIVP